MHVINIAAEDFKMRFLQLLRRHWVVVLFVVCILYTILIRAILSTWTRQEPTKYRTLQLNPPTLPPVAEAMVTSAGSVVEVPQQIPAEDGVCPTVYAQEMASYLTGNKNRKIPSNQHLFDCAAFITKTGIRNGLLKLERCTPQETPTPHHYLRALSEGCEEFKHLRGYHNPKEQLTEEEQFPLAFILLTDGRLEQTERLLRAIYRPHNVYCVYYSVLTPAVVRETLEIMFSCFSNVFLPQAGSPLKGYESPLEGDLLCMRELLQRSADWKYLLNLQSRQFPLRTNLELVRILKAYRGGNDVESQPSEHVEWTAPELQWDGAVSRKLRHPSTHGLILSKGSGSIAASRDFINFIIHSNVSADLLAWMKEKKIPEDHFYSTLNHNPTKPVPGAFYGKEHKTSLVQVQISENEDTVCGGDGTEHICTFGLADLYDLGHAPQLFAHRLYIELSPLTFTCLEQWHRNRSATNQVGSGFNQELYDKVPWALYHV